jgi:CRISPR-associated protein Cas1
MTPPELLPARMLNEAVYCPRLFALEHLEGAWADSPETIDGRRVHRQVDKPTTKGLPDPEEVAEEDPDRPPPVRSVYLGDPELQLIARIDLVEVHGDEVVPIDYKRGQAPEVPEGAWPPERVQVCAQALLLRAHGYRCERGVLYFSGSKRRVHVQITEELIAQTLQHRDVALQILAERRLPPPLDDSPKCRGCSLVGICLPDEHHVLHGHRTEVRPLMPSRDDGVPLYVHAQGAYLRKKAAEIVIEEKGEEIGRVRISDTNRVALFGNIGVSTPLLNHLAQLDIPVSYHSYGGWYQASVAPVSGTNVLTRIAQHRASADPAASLAIARRMVHAKITNARILLRRNGRDVPKEALDAMKDAREQCEKAPDHDTLRGIEGYAARAYFQSFHCMIRADLGEAFKFDGRNRRPPRDPINALLSFAYACLVREITDTARSIGLDAWVGFLHVPRAGRPALALDLMEEFRPIIADSIVINAVNNEVVQASDFQFHHTGVALRKEGKTRFIRVLERRLDELVTHPTFGSRLSYRRVIEVQARLLGKTVLGELDQYPGFTVR